jgi:queuosine precursor transporter
MFKRNLNLKETGADNEWQPKYFDVVACLYICTLVITWVTASKLFTVGPFVFCAAIIVYSLNCLFGDILTEIYGFNRTRRLIWMGFICGLIFVGFTQIAIALPPAPEFKLQEAFSAIHSQMPRIVFASFTAYLFNEFINSYVMSKMKVWSDANNFPLRATVSTAVSQLADSVVFFGIAFVGSISLGIFANLVFSSWAFRVIYEIVLLPLTTAFVRKLKTLEGIEHFDRYKLKVMKF